MEQFSGTLGRIVDPGVVAVMRGADPDAVVEIGRALVEDRLVEAGDFEAITDRAGAFVEAVEDARE